MSCVCMLYVNSDRVIKIFYVFHIVFVYAILTAKPDRVTNTYVAYTLLYSRMW